MAKKQKSGLYRTKIKVGVDKDGKDILKYISGKTKKELEMARQAAIEYYITGNAAADDRVFGAYVTEWYRVRKEPFITASTRANYRTMLNKHILPVFGDRRMRAIRPVELQVFINSFSGSSRSQITSAISTLQAIFRAAVDDRILDHDPSVNLRRPEAAPVSEKRALTDDERMRVQALFRNHRHGRYIAVMYYTGMRPGEVRGLQWGDFDWKNNTIHIQRDIDYKAGGQAGELKTESSNRRVPITRELRELLFNVRGLPGAYVFPGANGKPLAQVTAVRMWIELMAEIDLVEPVPNGATTYGHSDIRGKYKPLISPHTLRHNFITMCWEAGFDCAMTQKLVGHADYKTTMNIYTHLSEKHLKQAENKLDEMFAEKSCTKVAPEAKNEA